MIQKSSRRFTFVDIFIFYILYLCFIFLFYIFQIFLKVYIFNIAVNNYKNAKINERKFGMHDRIIRRFTIENTVSYNNSSTKQCWIKIHTNQSFIRIAKLQELNQIAKLLS